MSETGARGLTVGEVRAACGATHPGEDFRVVLKLRLPDGSAVVRNVSPHMVLPSVIDVVVEAEVELTEDDFARHGPHGPFCD